ncbi:acyl-CoA thioesterase [Candidatus Paracaedibacter symbiosus]|uniref:acyl-CoA thioesterase n=1 Tax=Candidatus Paracaedibacter symbiosus TaxID=244582 RepID=UPI00068DD0DC|nr:acyl-CoA thioesterase [Candidatus Paracaedibacter symbiosus]
MNLYIRLLILYVKSFFSRTKSVHIKETTSINLTVLPNDLDLNWHMNNGRYLTIMDLGRIDYMMKTGLLKVILRNKWFPVVSASQICYFRPLTLFETYTLQTTLESWNGKWYIMTQRFEKNGKLYAVAIIRGIFRDKKGPILISEILKAMDIDFETSPTLHHETEIWLSYIAKTTQIHCKTSARKE